MKTTVDLSCREFVALHRDIARTLPANPSNAAILEAAELLLIATRNPKVAIFYRFLAELQADQDVRAWETDGQEAGQGHEGRQVPHQFPSGLVPEGPPIGFSQARLRNAPATWYKPLPRNGALRAWPKR